MEYSYGELAFISYIVKGNSGNRFTVYLRLKDKVGVIEHTNTHGELMEPRKEKLIKTSAFGPFMRMLQELDILIGHVTKMTKKNLIVKVTCFFIHLRHQSQII